MNQRENLGIFNDKKKAYDLFGKYYKRELVLLRGKDDKELFASFASRHKSFIVKPYNGSGGKGILIYHKDDYINIDTLFEAVISKGTVVCEELVVQLDEMAILHSYSVNTVRIQTTCVGDDVKIFGAYLRMGRGNMVIDNAASNGILVTVDCDSGIVNNMDVDEKGGDILETSRNQHYYSWFLYPRWQEAVDVVINLAKVVKGNHYCGWDMALTNNGWIMIEANPRGQFAQQYVTHKGIKLELERLIETIKDM